MNIEYNYNFENNEFIILAIPKDKIYLANNKKFKSVNSLLQFCCS